MTNKNKNEYKNRNGLIMDKKEFDEAYTKLYTLISTDEYYGKLYYDIYKDLADLFRNLYFLDLHEKTLISSAHLSETNGLQFPSMLYEIWASFLDPNDQACYNKFEITVLGNTSKSQDDALLSALEASLAEYFSDEENPKNYKVTMRSLK